MIIDTFDKKYLYLLTNAPYMSGRELIERCDIYIYIYVYTFLYSVESIQYFPESQQNLAQQQPWK